MSPTAAEKIPNRPLSGTELRKLILEDIDRRLLEGEALLSGYMGFGRVAYRANLTLFLDNPLHPESKNFIDSRPASKQELEARPELAAVEPPPLRDPSPEAVISSYTLDRSIDSPNAERLRAGMPVPVEVKQQDGTTITEQISYPPSDDIEVNVTITDTTAAARAAAGLPPAASPVSAPRPELDELGKCGHPKKHVALSGICVECGADPWIPASAPDPTPEAPQPWPTTRQEKVDAFFKG